MQDHNIYAKHNLISCIPRDPIPRESYLQGILSPEDLISRGSNPHRIQSPRGLNPKTKSHKLVNCLASTGDPHGALARPVPSGVLALWKHWWLKILFLDNPRTKIISWGSRTRKSRTLLDLIKERFFITTKYNQELVSWFLETITLLESRISILEFLGTILLNTKTNKNKNMI